MTTDPSPPPPLMILPPPPSASDWAAFELRPCPWWCEQHTEGHAAASSYAPGLRLRWRSPHLRGRSSPPPSAEVGIAPSSASNRIASAFSAEVRAKGRRLRHAPTTTNTQAISKGHGRSYTTGDQQLLPTLEGDVHTRSFATHR